MIDLTFEQEPVRSRIDVSPARPEELAAVLGEHAGPRLLISDAHVARAWPAWLDGLGDAVDLQRWILRAGEEAKNSANLLSLLAEMHRLELRPDSPVIAFGGGMCGDLAALASSLWKRGLPFYYVPTSLLAMVDASVGGKTAINFGGLRNAIGTYWPARRVWIDPAFLATLPVEEWRSGFGELLKSAWLSAASWADELEAALPDLLRVDHPALPGHIRRAIEFKAGIVSTDFRDRGHRRLLNLGHSFAHALEAEATDAGEPMRHGEAVLIGMLGAVMASRTAGLMDARLAASLRERLLRVLKLLEIRWPQDCDDTGPLLDWMRQDKKQLAGGLQLILLKDAGDPCMGQLQRTELRAVWDELREACR